MVTNKVEGQFWTPITATSSAGRVAGAAWSAWATGQVWAGRGNSIRSNGDGVALVLSWARCR